MALIESLCVFSQDAIEHFLSQIQRALGRDENEHILFTSSAIAPTSAEAF